MLSEKKSICCHKCGHKHPMGTSCPTPFLKGDSNCKRKSLKEAELSKHYSDRKEERGTIIDIQIKGQIVDEEAKSKIIESLQKKLDQQLAYVESTDLGMSNNYNLGLVVFMPVLQTPKGMIPVDMICGNKEDGRYYIVVVANNNLLTMYPTNKKPQELADAVQQHIKRDRPNDNRPAKVTELTGYLYKIDLNGNEVKDVEVKPKIEKGQIEDEKYTVRSDYRLGVTFDHEQYGPGKIVGAEKGGKAGVDGQIGWLEVQYKNPVTVKSGKPIYTRTFNNIKTKAYFSINPINEMDTPKYHHGMDHFHQLRADVDEITEYCTECLAEYITERWGSLEEAEYKGRKVSLGKPFLTPGGPKKRSVYVKNAKGNVVKVNFGDPNLKIKKNIPARRKSFRARHKCDTAKDRTSPRYWSCKHW